jgi:hypothetical protein
MNEETKSFWWKIWGRPVRFFLGLTLVSLVGAFGSNIISDRMHRGPYWNDFLALSIIWGFSAIFIFAVLGFILSAIPRTRFLMVWVLRRWFFCAAMLVTLTTLFYAEENWRGKRAWEKTRHDLEAKGVVLNWDKFIPPPVPDDQNIFKAPKIQEWFVITGGKREGSKELGGLLQGQTNFPTWGQTRGKTRTIDTEAEARAYLSWSDTLQPQFNLIRDALKRPYARMDGDYSQIRVIPFPNFITIREIARTLAQRSHCYLVLHQPDKAVTELKLMHDLRHLLEAAPDGKPMTLVGAMINVAVAGVYVEVIGDGFRLHAWRAEDLVELEKQLSEIHLLIPVAEAFQAEPAATTRALETIPINKILGDFGGSGGNLLRIAPRGWVLQNIAHQAPFLFSRMEGLDSARESVSPAVFREDQAQLEKFLSKRSPYNIVARQMIPNFQRAIQTTARNQTLANEARIACALERYRFAHGQYPDALDALAPQFIASIPHDVIKDGHLIYQRGDTGFLLYSLGWNQKDDGGKIVKNGSVPDPAQGDWAWEYSTK